jgi:dihydropteroate synthase
MHMKGTPQTMQLNPTYDDVVGEVDDFFENRLKRLQAAGVDSEQVLLDVGIGFGKTVEHNLDLLAHLSRFTRHGRPLALGVSRKSFLGKLIGQDSADRLPGALACACLAAAGGVQVIRTHDVRPTVSALRTAEAILKRQC